MKLINKNKIRALIADDEPNQLELIAYNLVSAGFEVLKARNGEEALEIANEYFPDIIILDWMMPYMSGVDVCRKLRGKNITKHIPIIMLSARGEEGDRTLGLDTGADDYITKPFSPKELISRIKAVLRRSRPAMVMEMIEYGDLEINTAKKTVHRRGIEISLGPKEFSILLMLIERPGQVFNRTQILDQIWGHGTEVADRTVDAHFSRLRKALNKSGNGEQLPELFRTVSGHGYSLK